MSRISTQRWIEGRRAIRKARAADRARRRRIVETGFGVLLVTRRDRKVRITAVVKLTELSGRPPNPGVGFVDLDDANVDRLIQRLQAIRGGKRALP